MWAKEVTGNPPGICSLDRILQSIIHSRASREPTYHLLPVCRTRTVALMVVYFYAQKSGLPSPGKSCPLPGHYPLSHHPHADELHVGKGPPHHPPAFHTLGRSQLRRCWKDSSFIYGPWPRP